MSFATFQAEARRRELAAAAEIAAHGATAPEAALPDLVHATNAVLLGTREAVVHLARFARRLDAKHGVKLDGPAVTTFVNHKEMR